ncbi:MAG: Lrp/AsnC family transcriptional regulator [Candidatus Woesearchaeota archaeon]|jgi:DNA-binding Lrp family transcriptional regulator|nr:Lrp/AsnC family transcriptional regulator [Candidatus Woesearchaeota archaeon]MDP7180872.1 Lrp/AsnC family transcriptional regulator [Candidatus Woesearchaeota archaeon]MDP7199190.1 Lrp/AsnC family transcriptional regulator [Candidatus Woesearchaeota archaeon]MDP7467547.1 Lrp/AsnC family transcriptional regulator [Candidatus Woesearchaeota archaeon]MDP7647029.1 Lrp/AsnC family transcriptional regulator [Candidatus Woesearchaeota archaeon]
MIRDQDRKTISWLRKDGRMSLTELSRRTRIPVSTLFDRMKHHYPDVVRHSCLINFSKLGFDSRAYVLFKLQDKDSFMQYLQKHHNVNTLFRVNNGWNVMVEFIFPTMHALEAFLERLDKRFSIEDKKVHYVLEEVMRERFFTEPELIPLLYPKHLNNSSSVKST